MTRRPRSLSRLLVGLALLGTACDGQAPTAPAAESSAKPAVRTASVDPKTTAPPSSDSAPPPPQTEPEVVYLEAAGLHYVERVIGSDDPDAALPMVVAIHGLGDRPEAFSHLLDTVTQPARVILPRGLDAYEGGWAWFDTRARDPDVDKLGRGITKAADAIATGIAAIAAKRPTKGLPIVTGFSQGGMLSFALAVHHPEVVSVAMPVGGWLPPPLWPTEAPKADATYPPIVALHGTADAAVRYEPTKTATDALTELGYDVTLRTYDAVPHAIVPPMRRDLMDLLNDAIQSAAKLAAPSKATP